MAKRQTAEEAETQKSVGAQMKSKLTQKERNLLVKKEMIEKGLRPAPNAGPGETVHQKNVRNKQSEKEKAEKPKGKGPSK